MMKHTFTAGGSGSGEDFGNMVSIYDEARLNCNFFGTD